jgi:hypothetical protein
MAISRTLTLAGLLLAPVAPGGENTPMKHTAHLGDFPVVEFRRYALVEGKRAEFSRYFETYFPDAFQQLGALILGHFSERANPTGFVWIRGFHDMAARAAVNQAFYDGPLWKEHSATMNERLVDHTNVLLLQPLRPSRGVALLPAVDPIREERTPRGVVVAQVFALRPGSVEAFAERAEEAFTAYRAAGAREAGVLVTLDVPNNFPRLPFRTDGPYLVWLGVLESDRALETRFEPQVARALEGLNATGLLRGAPELIVLDPAARSRLRWLPE